MKHSRQQRDGDACISVLLTPVSRNIKISAKFGKSQEMSKSATTKSICSHILDEC